MPNEVEVDIPAYLTGQTVGTLTMTSGTNLFAGHPDDDADAGIPDIAVFCRVEGGNPPSPYFGGASADDWNMVTLAIYVRWTKAGRGAGRAAAEALNKLMHKGAVSGYTMVMAMQSSPLELEKDGKERHTWKMSYRVEWRGAL